MLKRVSREACILFGICAFDAISTWVLLVTRTATEANPVLAQAANVSPQVPFLFVKFLTFVPAIVFAEWYRQHKPHLMQSRASRGDDGVCRHLQSFRGAATAIQASSAADRRLIRPTRWENEKPVGPPAGFIHVPSPRVSCTANPPSVCPPGSAGVSAGRPPPPASVATMRAAGRPADTPALPGELPANFRQAAWGIKYRLAHRQGSGPMKPIGVTSGPFKCSAITRSSSPCEILAINSWYAGSCARRVPGCGVQPASTVAARGLLPPPIPTVSTLGVVLVPILQESARQAQRWNSVHVVMPLVPSSRAISSTSRLDSCSAATAWLLRLQAIFFCISHRGLDFLLLFERPYAPRAGRRKATRPRDGPDPLATARRSRGGSQCTPGPPSACRRTGSRLCPGCRRRRTA